MTTKTENLVNHLKENAEELHEIALELNSWFGSFNEFAVHSFDEDFFETFFADKPYEAARATHFGEVNWSDEYIRFNAYENLESLSEWKLHEELKESAEEIVEELLNNLSDITVSDEVQAILDEEDEDEE